MDFSSDPDLTSVGEEAARLAAAFDDEYWRDHDERHEFPWEFYNAFADKGWLGVLVPEAYGGAGLGVRHAATLLGAVGNSAGAMNAASTLHLSIFGMGPVIHHGSDALKEKYLPPTATGELHVSFGVTEDDAGTDTSRIRTTAIKTGDHWVINGKKVWNTKAQQAQKILLLARTTPREQCERRLDGMTLFLADLDRNYCEIREIPKLGRNAVNSNEVFIRDLPVADADVVGEVGRGFYHLLDGINPERIVIAAEAVGIGRRAITKAAAYARERVVFDRPIGANQAIAHPLADSWSELEAAELLWQRAAWAFDNGDRSGAQANMAKLRAADAAFRACDRALQTFGGFGYAREYDVERYWREARLMRLAPISQEMALNFIAEHVLDLPKSYWMASEYPDLPRVAVGVLVEREGCVLLVRRGNAPSQGLWAVPGGGVELGESLQDAAEREVAEETGVIVIAGEPIWAFDRVVHDDAGRVQYHYVVVDLMADYVSGEPVAATDATEACWMPVEQLVRADVSDLTRRLVSAQQFKVT